VTVECRIRDAAVPLLHYRLDHVKRDTAYEISVDFYSDAVETDVVLWTSIASWMRVKIGAGSYTAVGITPDAGASLGAFTAGQTKQCTIEVKVPAAADVRNQELGIYLGFGDVEWPAPPMVLYDTFTSDDAAPLDDPRTCEPGPGQLKPGPNNTAKLEYTSGGKMWWPVILDGTYSGKIWYSPTVTIDARSSADAGKAAFFHLADLSSLNTKYWGWSQYLSGAAGARVGGFYHTGTGLYRCPGTHNIGAIFSPTGKYLSVVRGGASFLLVLDGVLLWADTTQLELASVAYLFVGPRTNATAGNQQAFEEMRVVDLPAVGYPEWGPDFSTVTDSKSTPADTTTYDCAADGHIRLTFTFETGKVVKPRYRRPADDSEYYAIEIEGDGSLEFVRKYSAGTNKLVDIVGVFADGVEYQVDIVYEGSSHKVYVDNVEKIDITNSDVTLTQTGGNISHNLATNDIELSTHPYPSLGIANDRILALSLDSSASNDYQFTHDNDFVSYIRNVTLDSSNQWQFRYRQGDANNTVRLHLFADGTVRVQEVVTGTPTTKINTSSGTVSTGDDVCIVCDGADVEVFVNFTSVGTGTLSTILTGTTGDHARGSGWDGHADYLEAWPRDVSSLLPSGLT
jgi:hypothetical protein